MSKESVDVTAEYEAAEKAAANFSPGEQPSIIALMRSSYIHGYAQALIDSRELKVSVIQEFNRIMDERGRLVRNSDHYVPGWIDPRELMERLSREN